MVAQLISVLAYPFLSRLYSPTEMGLATFFFGISSILSIFLTGRYELAIILPKSDSAASNIALLAIFFASVGFIASFLIIFAFYPHLIAFGKNAQLTEWLYIVPIAAFLISYCQIMRYLGTRFREYQKLAISSVLQPLIYVSIAILLGVIAYMNDGLILSRILSYFGSTIIIAWMFCDKIQKLIQNFSIKLMWENGLRYKQFLFCNVPYSALGAFSKEFIIFSFVAFGYSESAGLYALARNILFIPISFLSSTLGQVFYQESATTTDTSKLEQLVLQLINSIIIFGVPGVIFFVIWACEIFSFCFGEVWWGAGTYAAIFMPAAFLSLFTSWPERLYEVAQKQYIALTIQVIFDSLSVFLLWFLLTFGFSLLKCILFYTILNCVYQLVYLINIFKISNFDMLKLLSGGSKILILTLSFTILLYFPCLVFTSPLAQFMGGMFILLGYYLFIVSLNIRPAQRFNFEFLLIDQKY